MQSFIMLYFHFLAIVNPYFCGKKTYSRILLYFLYKIRKIRTTWHVCIKHATGTFTAIWTLWRITRGEQNDIYTECTNNKPWMASFYFLLEFGIEVCAKQNLSDIQSHHFMWLWTTTHQSFTVFNICTFWETEGEVEEKCCNQICLQLSFCDQNN